MFGSVLVPVLPPEHTARAEISQENELSVTAQLKKLLQSCAGAAAAFLCDVSLGFVMDFS